MQWLSVPLDQYVNDLRAITAKENDPVKITDLVAPLAKKPLNRPGGFAPNTVSATLSKGSAFTCFTKSLTTIWRFFWFRGCRTRGTTPHNHKTWAVVVGMEGEEKEISYDRLDDSATPGYADLKRGGEQVITAGEITRCYPEHIHSVWNVEKNVSMSLHTYGRHINYTGRSEFDVERKSEKPYVLKVAVDEHARA